MSMRLVSKTLMVVFAVAATGCGDDDVVPGGTDAGRDAGAAPTDSGPMACDACGVDAGPSDAGSTSDAGSGATITTVHPFDPSMFELPEGIVLTGGHALVGIAPTGNVVQVDADGTTTMFGNVPFVPMSSYALGLALDSMGRVYVGIGAVGAGAIPGIYRIPATGGTGVLFASDPMMQFPNGLDFDSTGNLYVADSNGHVFKISALGVVTNWSSDTALAAAATSPCGPRVTPFPIGANGIVVEATQVIVAHTDSAALLRIAINGDGTAGAVTPVVADCTNLLGIDGIGQEAPGSWLATMQGTNGIARVTMDGTVTVLHTGAPLDGPASVDIGMFGTSRQAVITNSAFVSVEMMMTAAPSLATLSPVM